MANPKHVEILQQGVKIWNEWRTKNLHEKPDLVEARLNGADLQGVYLFNSDLRGADLRGADLKGANLECVNLTGANIERADLTNVVLLDANLSNSNLKGALCFGAICSETFFYKANLHTANLSKARLFGTNFIDTILEGTDLTFTDLRASTLKRAILDKTNLSYSFMRNANLEDAYLYNTILENTVCINCNFKSAKMSGTIFFNTNLSNAKNLEFCEHTGPSSIDQDTLTISGELPIDFLRGCGLSDEQIKAYELNISEGTKSLTKSCFISYSSKDEGFAKKLYSDLQNNGVRCWFAPEKLKGGDKLYNQISEAIENHDKLLIILSEWSIKSNWVVTEIKKAQQSEKQHNRRMLFPIRIVNYETINAWELFDSETGTDLASEVRSYYILDFSNWKDSNLYKNSFDRLLCDLNA